MTEPIVSTITPCYRMERYLQRFLDELPRQTIFDRTEVVLDLNAPSQDELGWVNSFIQRYPGRLKLVVTDPVQPIGTSMNTCIRNATGRYLTIWNVDDLRTPASLEAQVDALIREPHAGIAFGDYQVVTTFGSQEGTLVRNRDLPPDEHNRGMTIGPFFMFKSELCERAGLFDEQLRSGADFDLALRLLSHASWAYAAQPLGYYLSAGLGASTRPDSLQWVEKNLIYMRYGIWDKLEIEALPRLRAYHLNELVIDGARVSVAQAFRNYEEVMRQRDMEWLPRLRAPLSARQRFAPMVEKLTVSARNYRDAVRAVVRRMRS